MAPTAAIRWIAYPHAAFSIASSATSLRASAGALSGPAMGASISPVTTGSIIGWHKLMDGRLSGRQ